MGRIVSDTGYAAEWCIHYRGTSDGKGGTVTSCKKGVEYSTFRGTPFQKRPCFLTGKGESKPDSIPCEHLRRPTPYEIAADEASFEAHMNIMRTVMLAIKPWRQKHKGRSHSEVIECPACKGSLHLSISSYNGHVHGHCKTEGCVSWME